jgi:phage repressor protein C with HTH and peptisase S24 domain
MKEESSINQRLNDLIKAVDHNVSSFSNEIGVSDGTIRMYTTGRSKPGYEVLETIILAIDRMREKDRVNVRWLFTGEGEMFEPKEQHVVREADLAQIKSKTEIIVATQDTSGNSTIPIVNIKAAANYVQGYKSQEYFEDLDPMSMPRYMLPGGQNAVFQVKGDSMEPTIFDREYVICSKVEKGDWEFINDFDVFVVVSEREGVQLKRVKNRLKTRGFIRFRSDNRTAKDFTLHEDEILELWRFQWRLSPFAVNKAEELYKKVDDLEESLEDMRAQMENIVTQLTQKKLLD